MDDKLLLEKLQELFNINELDEGVGFSSQQDAIAWANKVAPLLKCANPQLHSVFIKHAPIIQIENIRQHQAAFAMRMMKSQLQMAIEELKNKVVFFDAIINRLDSILMEYSNLRKKSRFDDLSGGCSDEERTHFQTRTVETITAVAPANSTYIKNMYNYAGLVAHPQNLVGIIKALKADIQAGHIKTNKEAQTTTSTINPEKSLEKPPILDNHIKNITLAELLGLSKRLSLGAWGLMLAILFFAATTGFYAKLLKDMVFPPPNPLKGENDLLRNENTSLKETVAPLLKQASEKFPGEEISISLKKLITILQQNNPSAQPLRTATATVEIAVASNENINTSYINQGGYVAFGKGHEALLVMADTQCKAFQNGRGEVIYRGVFNMDATYPANGKPLSFLRDAEYIQIGFKPLANKSKVISGQVICIFNSRERIEVKVPPQEMAEDRILIRNLEGVFPEPQAS